MARYTISAALALGLALTASARAMVSPQPPSPSKVKNLVTFGDSYSQTGFNTSLSMPSPQNPLGNPPLPGWTTSGGLNWVGLVATRLNASATRAYNLASGGATTDATLVRPYSPEVSSLVDQVAQFGRDLPVPPRQAAAAASSSQSSWPAADTLVGVWMGVNDVGNTYGSAGAAELLVRVVDRYFEQLQVLYDGGLRMFVLLGVPPTHKTPLMINSNGPDGLALLQRAIKQYNDLLASKLVSFRAKNKGVTTWLVDTTAAFDKPINNPKAYGAPDATCFNSDGVSCLWFNDYHPGVQIQKLVAQAVAAAVGKPWFS